MLYELLKDANLLAYPDPDIRLAIQRRWRWRQLEASRSRKSGPPTTWTSWWRWRSPLWEQLRLYRARRARRRRSPPWPRSTPASGSRTATTLCRRSAASARSGLVIVPRDGFTRLVVLGMLGAIVLLSFLFGVVVYTYH
ncbi:MAG: hypothetical protein M3O95_09370, partial [Candidatus Dormibacteraeota bacterium]|nr:hypothetical protein [Candidatus Dormibacteraeota bacterium]